MYQNLRYEQVALAALLLLINAGISFWLRLGLERRLLWGAIRTVVQLTLIGFVLRWVFANDQPAVVLTLMALMTCIAGWAASSRLENHYPGIVLDSVASLWVSSWLVTAIALSAIVPVRPFLQAQYSIPLLGMILGNALNGVSLGLDRLGQEFTGRRDQIETMLALGATRWEAARDPIQRAVRTGMVPIIHSMMVVGVVSLPGMMTGQLLAGVDPTQAIRYQIVIMFLIAAAAAMGTVGVAMLGYRRLFNHRHQFLHGRIVRR